MRKYLLSYWKDGEEYGRTIRALSWEEALHMVNLRNRGEKLIGEIIEEL